MRPRRLIALCVAVGAFGVVGGLLFADRAPEVTRRIVMVPFTLYGRFEDRFGVDWFDRRDIPLEFDTAGHLVLWFGVGLAVMLSAGRRWSPPLVGLGLVAVSGLTELAQDHLSVMRSASVDDFVANVVGVTAGVVAGVALEHLHRSFRRLRSLTE